LAQGRPARSRRSRRGRGMNVVRTPGKSGHIPPPSKSSGRSLKGQQKGAPPRRINGSTQGGRTEQPLKIEHFPLSLWESVGRATCRARISWRFSCRSAAIR
jgi:hypothetical protein